MTWLRSVANGKDSEASGISTLGFVEQETANNIVEMRALRERVFILKLLVEA